MAATPAKPDGEEPGAVARRTGPVPPSIERIQMTRPTAITNADDGGDHRPWARIDEVVVVVLGVRVGHFFSVVPVGAPDRIVVSLCAAATALGLVVVAVSLPVASFASSSAASRALGQRSACLLLARPDRTCRTASARAGPWCPGHRRRPGSMKNDTGMSSDCPGSSRCSVKQKHSILLKWMPIASGATLNAAVPVTGRVGGVRRPVEGQRVLADLDVDLVLQRLEPPRQRRVHVGIEAHRDECGRRRRLEASFARCVVPAYPVTWQYSRYSGTAA